MASFHQITVVDYADGDADLRYTGEGDPVAGFSLGVTDKSKSGDEHTEWYRCSAWGKSADVAKEFIRKGGQVMVVGRPRVETFKRRDLTIGAMCHITVDRFVLLGSANGGGINGDGFNGEGKQETSSDSSSSEFTDDDMPL